MSILTSTDIKKRFPNAMERTYSAGQVLIYQDDAPGFVRFIKSGAVKFYDFDSDGREKILHIGGEGSLFPLFYSFEGKDSVTGFYATIVETEVIAVPLSDFQHALKTSPEYAFGILQWYAGEMDHIVSRLKSLEKSNAKQKVLQALYYLCDQHATKRQGQKWYRINFPLTQQTLADMTGLTRETVNITLKEPELTKVVRSRQQTVEIDLSQIKDAIDS